MANGDVRLLDPLGIGAGNEDGHVREIPGPPTGFAAQQDGVESGGSGGFQCAEDIGGVTACADRNQNVPGPPESQ